MKKIEHDFCCDNMFEAITENKIIDHDVSVREYGIRFRKNRIMMLSFCPWCGVKLPKPLMSKMFKVIWEEYGIPLEEADIYEFTNIPDEFKTDEWWKKRGL